MHEIRKARVGALIFACVAQAATAAPTLDFLPNLVGVGIGMTPQFAGSREQAFGAVPGVRLKIGDGNRFFEWYGPVADINLIDSPNWQFGPALGLRLGRHDADDAVVQKLPEIDATTEGGIMASWYKANTQGVPWTLRIGAYLMTDLGDAYHGVNATAFANGWLPLSPRVFLGMGGGVSWASASYNQTYFGVTPQGAAASGLPVYVPDSGLRQFYIWPALVVQLTPHWYGGAAVFYQRLAGQAGDSPIVTQRGDANQWTWGMGLGYVWK